MFLAAHFRRNKSKKLETLVYYLFNISFGAPFDGGIKTYLDKYDYALAIWRWCRWKFFYVVFIIFLLAKKWRDIGEKSIMKLSALRPLFIIIFVKLEGTKRQFKSLSYIAHERELIQNCCKKFFATCMH